MFLSCVLVSLHDDTSVHKFQLAQLAVTSYFHQIVHLFYNLKDDTVLTWSITTVLFYPSNGAVFQLP